MISCRFVPVSSQKGVLFLRHPVYVENFDFNKSKVADRAVKDLVFFN